MLLPRIFAMLLRLVGSGTSVLLTGPGWFQKWSASSLHPALAAPTSGHSTPSSTAEPGELGHHPVGEPATREVTLCRIPARTPLFSRRNSISRAVTRVFSGLLGLVLTPSRWACSRPVATAGRRSSWRRSAPAATRSASRGAMAGAILLLLVTALGAWSSSGPFARRVRVGVLPGVVALAMPEWGATCSTCCRAAGCRPVCRRRCSRARCSLAGPAGRRGSGGLIARWRPAR